MLSLLLFVFIAFSKDAKKAPLSLSEVLQRTRGQLEGLSSSLDGFSKTLNSDMHAASASAQKAVANDAADVSVSINDYKDSLKEIMNQVDVECKIMNESLKNLKRMRLTKSKDL